MKERGQFIGYGAPRCQVKNVRVSKGILGNNLTVCRGCDIFSA
jgi:hypothetical protein